MPRRGRGVRLRDVPAREVAAPGIEHLALTHQHLECLPNLVPRCVTVDVMHLVEVDVVRLEPSQALVARTADVERGEPLVVRSLAHAALDLGRQDDLLAPPAALLEPATDDLLGHALTRLPAVDVRGVEEVEAQLERMVHDGEAVRLAGVRTEVHGAEAERAHPNAG